MHGEDTNEVRQENELEALAAIFGDDLRDLRGKAAWNAWRPLDLRITLTPQQGSSGTHEIHAKVDLHIKCPAGYPNEIPEILLENSRGMSTGVLSDLGDELARSARRLVGEVMIFELAQTVQSFLHSHNKPGFKSFYEEMLSRRTEQALRLERERREENDRERRIVAVEIRRRQEILREEERRHKGRFCEDGAGEEVDGERRSSSTGRKSAERCDESVECDHAGTEVVEFSNNGLRQVQRGRCAKHLAGGCVVFHALDVATGEPLSILEWTLDATNADPVQLDRNVSGVEQEMNYLVKLRHRNLLHHLNVRHRAAGRTRVVQILQEHVAGVNVSSLLVCEGAVADVDLVRHVAGGVLGALEFLHRNNVVHKQVGDACVYIKEDGTIKLANYSICTRLTDLAASSNNSYNKKVDVLKFGLFVLYLVTGNSASGEAKVEVPSTLPSDLRDFLKKCLEKDEKKRPSAAQLLSHAFMRVPMEKCSPQRPTEDNNRGPSSPALSPEPAVADLMSRSSLSGQSRVQSEFEVMQWIGKGAFGDVIKVRNKLDGGCYAIKRIELNPKNRQLNRKITREVKLLSKLNHENVVRYYNAWIESAVIDDSLVAGSGGSRTTDASDVDRLPKVAPRKELAFDDDVELLAPPMKEVEWSISYESKSKAGVQDSGSSDSDTSDDDDDEWGVIASASDDSDSVEFERSGSTEVGESASSVVVVVESTEQPGAAEQQQQREIQFMYIQMEFCEKSTLRTAIDGGLHAEPDRVSRLFREIVEGLAHIHQQGMIHRDLKPVNIFLDSNGHVKIGDFGLATTSMLAKHGDGTGTQRSTHEADPKEMFSPDPADGSMTGQVGTALYTAPELSSVTKTVYNQKVDVYSLGIILFEMCYLPLDTQMERMKVLTCLRTKEVPFPPNFDDSTYRKQKTIIKWLLNHSVSQRPTSQELLQSDLIPPPVLEEEKLREMFRHTLSNPQMKAYKYLVASCFRQPVTPAQDITYDMSLPAPSSATRSLQNFNFVRETVAKVFGVHGGQNLPTPLLMPESQYYGGPESCVRLMTHSGSIITIPHDLRVPFARYVAWNSVSNLRRYSIERVYREKKIFGFHPRELYECAFDIVTPTPGNFVSDAEVLSIVSEIVDALPGLRNKNVLIRLNHTALLRAVLLHCGIKDRHSDVFALISNAKEGKVAKFQIKTHLISLGLSDNTIATLFGMIELESPLPKIVAALQGVTRKKSGEAGALAKQGLQELKAIIQNAESMGVTYNMVVAPGLVYNVQQYSGMMCQFVCELKRKRRRGGTDVLAVGGRYDAMVAGYRGTKEQAGMPSVDARQSAVGVSISLDKLLQALDGSDAVCGGLDAVVCSLGSKALVKEKTSILKSLWSAGIRCCLIEVSSLEEIQDQCGELNVPHVILLKDTEQGVVRIRSWERERFQERMVNTADLVENMHRIMKCWNGVNELPSNPPAARSDSKASSGGESHACESVLVIFVTVEKISASARRRYETQIKSQMDDSLKRLSGDVTVLAVGVDSNVVRTLASHLDFESDKLYSKSVQTVLERHQRQKKYLSEVCEEIYEQRCKRSLPTIAVYSIPDSYYRFVM